MTDKPTMTSKPKPLSALRKISLEDALQISTPALPYWDEVDVQVARLKQAMASFDQLYQGDGNDLHEAERQPPWWKRLLRLS